MPKRLDSPSAGSRHAQCPRPPPQAWCLEPLDCQGLCRRRPTGQAGPVATAKGQGVFERSSVSSLPPTPRCQPIPTLLSPQDLGSPRGSAPGPTRKDCAVLGEEGGGRGWESLPLPGQVGPGGPSALWGDSPPCTHTVIFLIWSLAHSGLHAGHHPVSGLAGGLLVLWFPGRGEQTGIIWGHSAVSWAGDGHRAAHGAVHDEQCGRGTFWLAESWAPWPLNPTPAPCWLWEPILRGPSGQGPSPGLWSCLTLCILRHRQAVEPGERQVTLSAFPVYTPCSQAAPGPGAFCIPRIILTECAPNPPSLPEARLEGPGPRTAPTPRPRTLAGSGRGWDGPQTLPGGAAEPPWPRSSLMPEKEGAALKKLGVEGYGPEDGGDRVPCSWGAAADGTQKPSPAETHLEETLMDFGCHAQTCSWKHPGQPVTSAGHTAQGATTHRMDSLEETLQELEATLSEMGTATTAGSPSSPPSLPPSPQVAASSPPSHSCLCIFRAGGSGGLQEPHQPPPPTGLLSAPATLLGAWCQAWVRHLGGVKGARLARL
ncbi:LOW QUALITY PROTEIN: uncharacterized protein [Eulemur rufifrons]|uniref:LOW QUALITY PROTEIN: uncharacterized protein n=1 Tax=Eulemur rufifrons TaxID=859984 RepID=UPI0037447A79